jgi:choline dehydrogenase
VIRYALAGNKRDVLTLTAVGRRVRDIYAAAPMRDHVVREVLPGPSVRTDEDWKRHIRHSAKSGAHPVGTCKMGIGPDAVVDPGLEVRGVNGLRIVDASIMPTIPSGNTNAATIMIGERGADLIMNGLD